MGAGRSFASSRPLASSSSRKSAPLSLSLSFPHIAAMAPRVLPHTVSDSQTMRSSITALVTSLLVVDVAQALVPPTGATFVSFTYFHGTAASPMKKCSTTNQAASGSRTINSMSFFAQEANAAAANKVNFCRNRAATGQPTKSQFLRWDKDEGTNGKLHLEFFDDATCSTTKKATVTVSGGAKQFPATLEAADPSTTSYNTNCMISPDDPVRVFSDPLSPRSCVSMVMRHLSFPPLYLSLSTAPLAPRAVLELRAYVEEDFNWVDPRLNDHCVGEIRSDLVTRNVPINCRDPTRRVRGDVRQD